MFDKPKLAPEFRPSSKILSDNLDQKISRKLQDLFVVDIQNDCACEAEIYDSDIEQVVIYLDDSVVKTSNLNSQICLPMQDDIGERDIVNLLEKTCSLGADKKPNDISLCKMLHNPSADNTELYYTFEKYAYSADLKNFPPREWIALDFVPENTVFFLPDPEYFGCLTANVSGYGAFCLANNVVRVSLE